MQRNSLAFRLGASSAIVACIILLAAALLLNQLFQQALERNFDARLRAVLDGVLANVELEPDGSPKLPAPLSDTRFTIPLSGWYWQIKPLDLPAAKDLASASLLEKRLELPAGATAVRGKDGIADFYMKDTQGKQLRALEQTFELFDSGHEYSFVVAGDFDELKSEVSAFRRTLAAVLSLLGLGLLGATLLQVRYGLKPMQEMQQKLNEIRSGDAEYLQGNFPTEMQPVADEMNLLIKTGFEILERSRMQVGNLAHALKTPLAVLTNEAAANKGKLAGIVDEQTTIMREQVELYLDRARHAAQARNLGASCDIEPVAQALVRTVQRIYEKKNLQMTVSVQPGTKFRGDQQDLEEMLGNLLDNACKWAKGRVRLTAEHSHVDSGRQVLKISVEDDGPGIPLEKRELAFKRGQRLDEKKPGSGLGLNIVQETAELYGGSAAIETSEMGGAALILRLPAVSR
jgi:signal transduction histidine kinase